jgi:hypothetical protein
VAVGAAALVGLATGTTVELPTAIPNLALQAAPVYRLEVGAAIFAGLYLVAMAFVLALHNHGFTEFGAAGVRSRRLDEMSEAVLAQEESMELLSEIAAGLWESQGRGGRDQDA